MPDINDRSDPTSKRSLSWLFGIGLVLWVAPASHGITGLLTHLGWFRRLGVDLRPWYVDSPAYLMLCWFAMGVGVTLVGTQVSSLVASKQSKSERGTQPDTSESPTP